MVAVHGIGIDTGTTLLVAVGQDPRRLKSEAAFAHLRGVAPIPASSSRVVLYRLNRRGNRDANRAVHVVAAERMSRDERTRAYAERRTAEGKSNRETMRCLKRYIAKELCGVPPHGGPDSVVLAPCDRHRSFDKTPRIHGSFCSPMAVSGHPGAVVAGSARTSSTRADPAILGVNSSPSCFRNTSSVWPPRAAYARPPYRPSEKLVHSATSRAGTLRQAPRAA